MRELRFLCLAVSRRDGGKCIAGLDLDSGEWIRPVDPITHGAITNGVPVQLENRGGVQWIAPLDVALLCLGNDVSTIVQPENRELIPPGTAGAYKMLPPLENADRAEILEKRLQMRGPLLHSYGESITSVAPGSRMLTHSLSLIRPSDLFWRITPKSRYPSQLQVRGDFEFDGDRYNLPVTDPVWESLCLRLGKGRHPHSAVQKRGADETLLVVSLGAETFLGQHYKLIAGVIILPAGGWIG